MVIFKSPADCSRRQKNNMKKIIKNVTDNDIKNGTFVIPEGATEIKKRAFYECITLESLTIPEGVTKISELAFEDCIRLESIIIPDGVTKI
ncbi:MAG: leucine-rich repeat domain-containing protein, partial [Clostridia bacterium]|nr:leucine-rich repeat domain-containing protein [Clostridia bacterium]